MAQDESTRLKSCRSITGEKNNYLKATTSPLASPTIVYHGTPGAIRAFLGSTDNTRNGIGQDWAGSREVDRNRNL